MYGATGSGELKNSRHDEPIGQPLLIADSAHLAHRLSHSVIVADEIVIGPYKVLRTLKNDVKLKRDNAAATQETESS